MSDSKYYNFDRIRSYNRMFNMIVGARGCGKTFGAKRIAIKNFIKKGEQFVYVRRYKSEIKEDRKFEQFFDDIRQEFPDHELTIKGNSTYNIMPDRTCCTDNVEVSGDNTSAIRNKG